MAKYSGEFNFSFFKRKNLIRKLSEEGFIIVEGSNSGQNIYVTNPKENHPKILGHYLPVAFMRRFYTKLVNLDEPALKSYHEKIREIHSSLG